LALAPPRPVVPPVPEEHPMSPRRSGRAATPMRCSRREADE
jgi:hypothetical protein